MTTDDVYPTWDDLLHDLDCEIQEWVNANGSQPTLAIYVDSDWLNCAHRRNRALDDHLVENDDGERHLYGHPFFIVHCQAHPCYRITLA